MAENHVVENLWFLLLAIQKSLSFRWSILFAFRHFLFPVVLGLIKHGISQAFNIITQLTYWVRISIIFRLRLLIDKNIASLFQNFVVYSSSRKLYRWCTPVILKIIKTQDGFSCAFIDDQVVQVAKLVLGRFLFLMKLVKLLLWSEDSFVLKLDHLVNYLVFNLTNLIFTYFHRIPSFYRFAPYFMWCAGKILRWLPLIILLLFDQLLVLLILQQNLSIHHIKYIAIDFLQYSSILSNGSQMSRTMHEWTPIYIYRWKHYFLFLFYF